MVAHTCNLSTLESKAGGLHQVSSQPGFHSEFQASLAYRGRPQNTKREWRHHCTDLKDWPRGSFHHHVCSRVPSVTSDTVWALRFPALPLSLLWTRNISHQLDFLLALPVGVSNTCPPRSLAHPLLSGHLLHHLLTCPSSCWTQTLSPCSAPGRFLRCKERTVAQIINVQPVPPPTDGFQYFPFLQFLYSQSPLVTDPLSMKGRHWVWFLLPSASWTWPQKGQGFCLFLFFNLASTIQHEVRSVHSCLIQ